MNIKTAMMGLALLLSWGNYSQACDYKSCEKKFYGELGGPMKLNSSLNYMSEKDYLRGKATAEYSSVCGCFLDRYPHYRSMINNALPSVRANMADWEANAKERKAKNAKDAKAANLRKQKQMKVAKEKELAEELRMQKLKAAKKKKWEDLQAAKAKNKTPECQAARNKLYYCQNLAMVESFDMVIQFENKVGEESGYVNKAKLRNAGAGKIRYKGLVEQSNDNYRNATGKSLSPSLCKFRKDNQRNIASITDSSKQSFYAEIDKNCGSRTDD